VPKQQPHLGLLLQLFSISPHPQQQSYLLSGPALVNASTRCHTPAALLPLLIKLCVTLLPFTTKTTNDEVITPFCLIFRMVRGFASHRTWVGMATPSFSVSNSSCISCRPSVPCPMTRSRGTALIFSLHQVSFSSTSMAPLLTVLAAVIMMSRYHIAISADAFWCVIAVIAPFVFLLAFMILLWAGGCW